MKYGKAVSFTLLGVILIISGLNMIMNRARHDAEVRTKHIYDERMKGKSLAPAPGVTPGVFDQLRAQNATLGRVRYFRISGCITQITTRPSICSVYVARERSNSIEKLYWYGGSCLRLETETAK
ncbi:MAG: hypothetical protein ACOYON_10155 [Fimbriimonas sp.]